MMNRSLAAALAAAAFALASMLAACATTAPADRLPADAAPLLAPDGAPFDLAQTARTHSATVLIWWSSRCPCVGRYLDRIADLRDRYAPRGVALVFVASNADDDPATLARHAASAPLPLLHDPHGTLARRLGVVSTPTAVVLTPDGVVAFRGWIDNERLPGAPDRQPWLADALDATLAGAPPQRQTPAWGCMITRSLSEPTDCGTQKASTSP